MRTLASIAETLKTQPFALVLLLVNVLFIGATVWVYREDSSRRSELIATLIRNCGSPHQ